ncbi:putative dynactin 2 [Paratrimastix pyriformis]|uniref:Dynactin 2 n=1 Tax=Paratrimastix pyriformis TaxID=342808 RepID=A0ABQ8UHQ4_9EUKA|nr:putative dynactin 2 [Paratrimastix pyriformis]
MKRQLFDEDTSEPEVYESEGRALPVAEILQPVESDLPEIEKPELNAALAFRKLSTEKADIFEADPYTPTPQIETLPRRLQRLHAELETIAKELSAPGSQVPFLGVGAVQEEVDKMRDAIQRMDGSISPQELSALGATDPLVLQQHLALLARDAASTALAKKLSEPAPSGVPAPTGLSPTPGADDMPAPKAAAAAAAAAQPIPTLTYELYSPLASMLPCPPAVTGQPGGETRLLQLEDRVAQLEKTLGTRTHAPLDIEHALRSLEKRMQLLDPKAIQDLEMKLPSLVRHLDKLVAAQKLLPALPSSDKKLDQMYVMLLQCQEAAARLPAIIDRLVTLRGIHQEAGLFHDLLQGITSGQERISGGLNEDAALLSEVRTGLAENARTIADNVSLLQRRIEALRSKLNLPPEEKQTASQ